MKTKFTVTLSLLLFLVAGCLQDDTIFESTHYACGSSLSNSHPDSMRLQTYLDDKISAGIPGMVMLVSDPQGSWMGAAGQADLASGVEMKPCNIMRVGSITKTFTATLIMMLQEQGKLSIDDPIQKYLDDEIVGRLPNADTATIRNLLNHTSGIADYSDNIDYSLAQLDHPTRNWTAAEELEYALDEDAQFDLGSKRNYCNTNFLLLGLIAEGVAGESGVDLFRDLIFNPLGMANTYFSQDGSTPEGIARGYYDDLGGLTLRDATHLSFAHNSMAGGICSTAEDLALFLDAIVTPGILLSRSSLDEMQKLDGVQQLNPPKSDDRKVNLQQYGLGLISLGTERGNAVGHGGRIRGYSSFMMYFPKEKISLIYLMNASNGKIKDIEKNIYQNEILDLLFPPS